MREKHGAGGWCLLVFLLAFLFVGQAADAQGPAVPAVPVPAVTAAPEAQPETKQEAQSDLILQLVIDGTSMADFVEGIQQGGKIYLPIGQLSSLLDFPITVNVAKKTADGWFIRESNKFSLTEASAKVKGSTYNISPGDLIIRDQDIFVDIALLQKWMPLTFSVQMRDMILTIAASEKLPFEQENERKKMHARLATQNTRAQDISAKSIDQPYAAAQWPSIDLTYSPSRQNKTNGTTNSYSALAVGDLGFLTSRLYASGDLNKKPLSDLRFSAGRDDYQGHLLGPAKATSFAFGDVTGTSLDQVTSGGQGRGFTMTNRALDRPDSFDVTNFIGDSKPGWEVELYRNDVLLDFQTVDSSGRYAFNNVAVLYGDNVFKLLFYGPQGQREEVTKTINAGSNLLKRGEFSYNVSAAQKLKTLFGIADQPTPGAGMAHLASEVEYGLSNRLTATVGGAYVPDSTGKEHAYTTAGLHTSFIGLLAGIDNAYDTTTGGHSSRASLTGKFFGTDFQVKEKIADNFVSESDTTSLRSETDVSLSRGIEFPFAGLLDNVLTWTRNKFTNGREEMLGSYRLSKNFMGMSLTNSLSYDHDNKGLNKTNGIFVVHKNFSSLQVDGEVDYDLKPLQQFTKTKLTALFPFNEKVSNLISLTNTFTGTPTAELEDTVTFDMKKYKLSLTGRANNRKNYYVGASFNTALGKVPGADNKWIASSRSLAETGTVAVRPFIDHNYNQQLDKGEELMPQADMKIGSYSPKVDEQGYFIETQLAVDLPVKVAMNQQKQDDPYLQDRKIAPNLQSTAFSVVPRAGKIISLDYPIFETSQVEGTVHAPAGSSAANMRVELVTSEGQVVGTAKTAFDGYYIKEGVMPGTYKIRIADESLAEAHLKQSDDRVLVINAADMYTRDITLESETQSAAAPTPVAAAAASSAAPVPAPQPEPVVKPAPQQLPVVPQTPAVPAKPAEVAPAEKIIGDVRHVRISDDAGKTRLVLDMTVNPEGTASLENGGKTLVVPLQQMRWQAKKSWVAKRGRLVVGYHLEKGMLRLDLAHPSEIEQQFTLEPDSDGGNYRWIIDLYSKKK